MKQLLQLRNFKESRFILKLILKSSHCWSDGKDWKECQCQQLAHKRLYTMVFTVDNLEAKPLHLPPNRLAVVKIAARFRTVRRR
ncbi:hypothetical protein ACOMHN_013153 [Nucella lapillus]